MSKIEQLDRALFFFLNSPHTDLLDSLMWYVSTTWIWLPLYGFFLYFAYRKGQFKQLFAVLIGIVCCVAIADAVSVHGFKEVWKRPRPTHHSEIGSLVRTVNKPDGTEYRGGKYGFVSSHAANIGAITTFILLSFYRYSKRWLLLMLWTALVSYSRIYLGVHYPSDIFGGALLGIAVGSFVFYIAKKLQLKNHHAPL